MSFAKTLILTAAAAAGALLCSGYAAAAATRHISFQASDEIIINPERGLFHHLEYYSDESTAISADYLRQVRQDDKFSLVFVVYGLRSFRNGEDISDEYLQRIRNDMATIRAEGLKAVLRFSYSNSESDYPRDVPFYACKRHIEQLTPILQENSDVIAVLEAGFIGAWGEWYYTDNYVMNPSYSDYGPRKDVLLALLDAMPSTRFVSVRYPAAKLGVFQLGASQSITAATAHNGSYISRTGFHNDCFLGDADDVGTFGYNQHYRLYWKAETQYVPMGGETCTYPNEYTTEENALANFADYHWSYLNVDYHPGTISEWKGNGFLSTISRQLGYRLCLQSVDYNVDAVAGQTWEMTLSIENKGWAAPFNPRDVEIIFMPDGGEAHTFVHKVDADPRLWLAGTTASVPVAVTLPEDMLEGNYQVYLNLPDPCESLHDDSRYSIRLANEGLWVPEKGYNKLFSIDVTGQSSVSVIATDSEEPLVDVYTADGRTVKRNVPRSEALQHLSSGIYLRANEKVLVK